jgi:DNA polymerase elongation subunit (family B)
MSKMLEFQIYDWMEDHEIIENDSDESSEETLDKDKNYTYIIHTFGRTQEGKSVYMKIVNYTPYFYIKLPEKWDKTYANSKLKPMLNYFKSNNNKKVWKKFRSCLINMDIVEKLTPDGFTNGKKCLYGRLIFNNAYAMKKFRYLFEQSKVYIPGVLNAPYQFKTYEANLPPMLRCFHIMKVSGCGWVNVEKYQEIKEEYMKESFCDIEIRADWRKIKPINKDFNAPLRILSFDIECYSIDGEFPQAKRSGDAIIQIGSTYTYLGENLPYRQHIVCLKKTDNLPDIIVESYETEQDMINGWIKELITSDCDIITGYNIFYFDETYIYERCKEILGLELNISKISKLKNYECKFRDFKLESSALGENQLRMFDTPGRIHIDLMKDVQKTFKLSSYKLDYVASNFIRDKIKKIELKNDKCYLYCQDINDIFMNDFIHIELVLDYVVDFIGYKYEIIDIDNDNKILTIKPDKELIQQINNPKAGNLYWSQAKDDVGPKDIFRLYRGNSNDRAIVAKYCVKDCRLVNLLINKLQVITKNIEMSNVCWVPLSYLFTRGQGIKLFSLTLKYYRDEGYVFPVLIKPEEKTPSYEGAIVFDPEPSITYEALAVKDYASLYPSSIIHKNMSHETLVIDEQYDNLPNVEYFNAKYREYDGSIQYRRFAKVNNQLGVIPKILQTLLKERKNVKKIMKNETDKFKELILDAKQLALKITANSLYGGFGADTSQVRNRDIAACTTSTGREMLIFAKKYDEEIVPGFINGIKKAYLDGDDNMAENIMKYDLKDKYNEDIRDKIKKYVMEDIKDYTFQPIIRYGDTDSIFSCYRFRENTKKLNYEKSYNLWKEIIKFSEDLIGYFIPFEYRCLWESLHQQYYKLELITDLTLPKSPNVLPEPKHYKILLPIEERMKQFLKEYMEETFMSWLWTLQDIMTREYKNKKIYDEILEVKLFKMGIHNIEKMRLETDDMDNDKKNNIIDNIKNFIDNHLKNYIIQPYWFLKDNNKYIGVEFYKNGDKIIDKRSLSLSIEMGKITGETVKGRLPFPHDLEYEKTFWPYLILTKKRYVGNKYEFNPDKYKQDYNGIVLKRRDNAPIVKEICGGIINCLINDKDPKKAEIYTKKCLEKMFNNEYNIKYFLTSKTLKTKESYSDWNKIAHVVLADRIAIRDPGNCPQSGDRISYAYIKIDNLSKETLQGDRIETPEYIEQNKLQLDYQMYMTNQIMKPALQFLNLALKNPEKMFNDYLIKLDNQKNGRTNILDFCMNE